MMTAEPVARETPAGTVVLVATGGLGDAILFSPVFWAAHRAYPNHTRILVAASPPARDLYARTPEIDQVLLVDTNRPWSRSTWRQLLALWRLCRRPPGTDLLACASRLSRRQTALFNLICRPARLAARPDPPADMNDLAVNRALAEQVAPGVPVEPPFVPVLPADRADLDRSLAPLIPPAALARAVAVYPSTPRPNRPPWPLPALAECADTLARRLGGRVVVVGGEDERRRWETECAGRTGVVNLAGRLTMAGTAALFARVRLALCNDGGLMHVAGALNCPLVAILTNVSGRYAPPGRFTRVVTPGNTPCYPCYPGATGPCPHAGRDRPCLAAITPHQVLEAGLAALAASDSRGLGH